MLLTRRALHKKTWPGVWTNTVCGHPGPDEPIRDAVRRRARDELGLELDTLTLVLPAYRYRFAMDDGTVENAMCPVFVATTDATAPPDPDEVDDIAWVDWDELTTQVLGGALDVSPWCADQLTRLPARPWSSPDADRGSCRPPCVTEPDGQPGRGPRPTPRPRRCARARSRPSRRG